MAHEVVRMFSTGSEPWHFAMTRDRTTVFEEYPGREAAMKAAGHDFTIAEREMLLAPGDKPDWAAGATGKVVPGWKAIIREDTEQVVGVTRKTYECIQPTILYDLQEAFNDAAPDEVRYETGGTLRDGAILWTLSRLGDGYIIPGDDSITYPYLSVSTSNDGSHPLTADATDVRVVCANTFGIMKSTVAGGRGRAFTFRHTAKWRERVEAAKQVLVGIRDQHEAFVEYLHGLGAQNITDETVKNFLVEFIPAPPEYLRTDRVMANVEEARDAVRAIINGGTVPEDHKRTAYGLYLAGVEYLDHVRVCRKGPEGKFNRSMLNHDKAKDGVVRLIEDLVAAA